MSSCYLCYRSPASIRCLICERYFCLTCSGLHRENHLLDGLEQRLTTEIERVPIDFNEDFNRQYRQAQSHLQLWFEQIRREIDRSFESEFENLLKSEYEILKRKTDEYIREQVRYLDNLRSNVRYAKARSSDFNPDQEIIRLVSIEKNLLEEYKNYYLRFRLRTFPIDFKNYLHIENEFHEGTNRENMDLKYSWNQSSQTLVLRSTIQQIAASGLDLFVFVVETPSTYPRLLEFSTSLLSSKLSLSHSIDFPHGTNIDDMCWSVEFNSLFLLGPFYLHKYDKYNRKINGKILEPSNLNSRWQRITTNRFGVFILDENNSIDLYTNNFSNKISFQMKDFINDMCLVYDLRGCSEYLCTLSFTNQNRWKIDLFRSRLMEHQRSFTLTETLKRPLKLLNGSRRNTWFIVDGDNHRIIIFDQTMNNIEYFPLDMTPSAATILDDQTLIVVSSDISGTNISFFSSI